MLINPLYQPDLCPYWCTIISLNIKLICSHWMQLCSFCCPSKFRCCQGQIIIKVWNHHAWSSPKISSHWASLYKLHLLSLLCSVRLCRFSGGDSRLLPMQQEGSCCGAVIALMWYSLLQDPDVFGSHCKFFSHSRSSSFLLQDYIATSHALCSEPFPV